MSPVALSSSYLLRLPNGISTIAVTSSGGFGPGTRSRQRFNIAVHGPFVCHRRFVDAEVHGMERVHACQIFRRKRRRVARRGELGELLRVVDVGERRDDERL